jgi:Predicted integral membrane protein (DUF2269)
VPVPLAASAYEVVMAFHVMAVVIAFGWTFALPFFYAIAVKRDPRSLPLLHHVELMVSRYLLNPALLVILGAGIFMASDGHHWSEFFVQWGLGVVIVIGGLVGAVLMPAARRAEETARRDLEGYAGGEFQASEEYREIAQRLNLVGSLASTLVLLTIFFMVIKP